MKDSPEWNHYRVEARDGELRLSVNGKEVTVGIEFVNILIKPLDTAAE